MPPKNRKYKKAVVRRSVVVQGFNIQGSDNILKGTSVVNNTAMSGTTEEEIIIQGFNLTEQSRNNDLTGAIARGNEVIAYESDHEVNDKKASINNKIIKSQQQQSLTIVEVENEKQEESKDQEISTKMIKFLQAKQIFLNTRQGTIQRLQTCCNELETELQLGKYAKFGEASTAISGVGGAISTPTFGLIKLVGELGLAANNSAKLKFLEKKINEFNNYLLTDEKKLFWFKERYDSGLDTNPDNKSFNDKHNPFSIIDQVWKNKSYLSLEEMKGVIKSLSANYKDLEKELEIEKKRLEGLVDQQYQAQQNV